MENLTQWLAPAATTIAAMMTAANGGVRLTGYGFAVFAAGSVAWAAYGFVTGQDNLVVQNAILLVINLVGVWRWLGRAARFEAGAEAADDGADGRLVAASALPGMAAVDRDGAEIGSLVDAMIASRKGQAVYAVLSTGGLGGVGERLFAVPWRALAFEGAGVVIATSSARLEQAAGIARDDWPASAGPDWDAPVPR